MATTNEVIIPTLDQLLGASAASPEFKEAVRQFAQNQRPNECIAFAVGNPPVKVLRVISGLLERHPSLGLRHIQISGQSGCSDYRGTAVVNHGEARARFVWDCRWRAEQMGWRDYFGEPDQIRAAKTFGFQCFQELELDRLD